MNWFVASKWFEMNNLIVLFKVGKMDFSAAIPKHLFKGDYYDTEKATAPFESLTILCFSAPLFVLSLLLMPSHSPDKFGLETLSMAYLKSSLYASQALNPRQTNGHTLELPVSTVFYILDYIVSSVLL